MTQLSFADLSEVVRAGIRQLMERDGARRFHAPEAESEEAVREAEKGDFEELDPCPANPRRVLDSRSEMTIRPSRRTPREISVIE